LCSEFPRDVYKFVPLGALQDGSMLIGDPYGLSDAAFFSCYEAIARNCDLLAEKLLTAQPSEVGTCGGQGEGR